MSTTLQRTRNVVIGIGAAFIKIIKSSCLGAGIVLWIPTSILLAPVEYIITGETKNVRRVYDFIDHCAEKHFFPQKLRL
jgi:hypothetical protein